MRNLLKFTAVTLVALLLVCSVLSTIGGTLRKNSTPPTAIATAMPAPAAVEPTSPPPNAPAEDALDVAAYARAMAQHATTISSAIADIGKLSKTPRLTDPNWKIDMATAFAILRAENTAMQQITPPSTMRDSHAELLLATADFDAMTYRYAAGLDTMDASEITAAIALMQSGTRHITRATELMQAK